MSAQGILRQLQQVPASRTQVRRQDFDLGTGTAGQRTKIAEYEAETPIFLRPDADMRLAFTAVEQFSTDGTADNSETFDLSHNVMETVNTSDLVLFEDGARVSADSVNYDANSFDYTSPNTGTTLHAYYVVRDGVRVEIERQAPRSQGAVEDVVWDGTTAMLHERNQHKEPLTFDGSHPLDLIVPRKWTLQVYAKGPVPLSYTDEDTGSPQDTEATNAVLKIPVRKASHEVPGLAQAVKQRIIDPSK